MISHLGRKRCHLWAFVLGFASSKRWKPPKNPMTEPQLSIRSAKAKTLAHALARRTGLSMNRLVETALERFEKDLVAGANAHPIDAVWDLAAEGRSLAAAGTTSAHDDFYDEHGLPK